MKKILLLAIGLIWLLSTYGQSDDTTKYLKYPNIYGYQYPRIWGTKVLRPPVDTVYTKYGLAILSGSLWYGDGTWHEAGSGGSSGGIGAVYNGYGLIQVNDSTLAFDSATIHALFDNYFLNPADTNYIHTSIVNNTTSITNIINNTYAPDEILEMPVVTWSGTGFKYYISYGIVRLHGTIYSFARDSITFDAADADPRYDKIIVTDTGYAYLKGIAASPPLPPMLKPHQIELYLKLINPGDTQGSDDGVTTIETIYKENVGQPTEYDATGSAFSTVDVNSADDAYEGTKSIHFAGVNYPTYLNFSTHEVTIPKVAQDITAMTFRLKGSNFGSNGLIVFTTTRTPDNAYFVNSTPVLVTTGRFGFDSTDHSSWQYITIPKNAFGFVGDSVKTLFFLSNSPGADFFIDNIEWNEGVHQSGSTDRWYSSVQTDSGNVVAPDKNSTLSLHGINGIRTYVDGNNVMVDGDSLKTRFGKSGEDDNASEDRHFNGHDDWGLFLDSIADVQIKRSGIMRFQIDNLGTQILSGDGTDAISVSNNAAVLSANNNANKLLVADDSTALITTNSNLDFRTRKLPFKSSALSTDSLELIDNAGKHFKIATSAISSGSTNSNTGSGYRWAVPGTNNIKTVFGSNTIIVDSSSNTNALTINADTSLIATVNDITDSNLTLASFGSSPNSNGASLSGQVLTLQPASASNPGGVSTSTQSFGGTKTFTSGLLVNGANTTNLQVANNATLTNIYLAGSSTTLNYHLSTSPAGTGTANNNYIDHYFGGSSFTEATSGTHNLVANSIFNRMVITNGSATTTNAATVYIPGSATGTVPTNNYALWVDSGLVRIDGTILMNDGADSAATKADVRAGGGGGGYTNLTQFVAQSNHRLFYSDGSGDVQEQAFGSAGTFYKSSGTTSAPGWNNIDTSDIANFYTKVRSEISVTNTGTSGNATYNNATGVLNIPNYANNSNAWNGLYGSTVTGNSSLTLAAGSTMYTFNGAIPRTYTLPDLATTSGRTFFIKNGGSADLTITRAGSDEIWTTTNVTSVTLTAGNSLAIVAVTGYWYVYFNTGSGGGGTGSNLSYDAANHEIDIDGGGTSAVIPLATSSANGLLSTANYRKVAYEVAVGTDANITAVAGTAYHLPAATLSTGRTIDMTNVNTNGDWVEFYNNETGFVWSFTGQTVYDSDGSTVVTELLAACNSVVRRVNGKLMISKL